MLRNNLIVGWRNLRRYRLYTAINVGGLAAAFAVAIFVGLYVHRALTWDRFHTKGEEVFYFDSETTRILQTRSQSSLRTLGSATLIKIPPAICCVSDSNLGNCFENAAPNKKGDSGWA